MKIDVHQHLWTEPLVQALAAREELPFVRRRARSHRPVSRRRASVRDRPARARTRPAAQRSSSATVSTGRSCACRARSGIEWLPREQAEPLLDAYHEGALSLEQPFGVWGAIALDRPTPDDVDRALARGCVGLSLPGRRARERRCARPPAPGAGAPGVARRAAARASRARARRLRTLARVGETSLGEPLWWPALTRYVAGMQAAWLAFRVAGRRGIRGCA